MVKVAINGFGRIGRNSFRVYFEKYRDEMQVVAVNDLVDSKTLAHLLKYDSTYGVWNRKVSSKVDVEDVSGVEAGKMVGKIVVDGVEIATYATKDPAQLPWKDLGVDVVIESTGRFRDEESLRKHIEAGAKKVVLSAPAKGGNVETFLLGVNKKVSVDEVNKALEEAAGDPNYEGILAVTKKPIVSSDIVGRSESAIVDLSLTQVVDGDMVKVFAWYDNEWGYSNRLVEQVIQVGKSITQ